MIKKTKQQLSKQRRQSEAPKAGAETQNAAKSGEEAAESTEDFAGIPVVGMGGSAGSLEAFKSFFKDMPADSGAAFVVIMHLSPTHESLLPELLTQHTQMRVVQARDATHLYPNCVYVIPPNRYLTVRNGILYLVAPIKQEGIRMPIDFFFRSLAEDMRERAICMLFSGAGSDGTLGVRAVRGAGGLSIAQDPATAQFNDMPSSAVATGLVDFVLSPGSMPEVILNYIRHPYVRGFEHEDGLEADGKIGGLQEILALVLSQTGHDFRSYKQSNILRRVERRMGLHRITEVARYYDLLHRDTNETTQLFKDFLINVTSFFRDQEAFEELREKVIAPLVKARHNNEPLRVWVAGCASGEEAFSLAMLMMEEVTAAGKNCPVQIYATDLDAEALEFARQGVYPETIAADVGSVRLARFFIQKGQSYRVSESLRELVVFAVQDLIADPPFSRMDIISCRNLMIYLDTAAQAKLIPLFNFALNAGGYLFLGKSEGIGNQNDLFDVVSKKARIYRRLIPPRPIVLDTPVVPGRRNVMPLAGPSVIKQSTIAPFADVIRQTVLSHFAACVVLVDLKGQILQFHGQTGKYLNMPTAEPILNIRDIAKEGLSTRLRAALHNAAQDGKTVVLDRVPVTRDEGGPFVCVTIVPTSQRGEAPPLLAIIFEDVPRPSTPTTEQPQSSESYRVVEQLEEELRATQQELQSSIMDLQASNEELRVANEEVLSSNEELQSTVEELETSKEELQSVNEELTTVNSELRDKVDLLAEANSDLDNVLKSAEIGMLFLDGKMRIKFFTPAITRVLQLIPSDTGRTISDMSMNFIDYKLTSDAMAVAGGGNNIEREVQHADGSYYLMRVMPYLTQKGQTDGVVITFSDVTRIKLAEKEARRLATVLTDSNDAVLLFDPEGKFLAWNHGAQNVYGWSEAEALQLTIYGMTPSNRIDELSNLIQRMMAGETVSSFETQRKTKDGRVLDIWLTLTAVWDEAKTKVEALSTTERDITELKRAEEEIKRLNADLLTRNKDLEFSNKELESFIYSVSHDLRAPLRHMSGFADLLMKGLADKLDEKEKRYISLIRAGAEKMSRLIDDLLNLSRISRQDIKRREINMSAMAAAIVDELREAHPGRSVEVKIQEGVTAFADRGLIEVVLSNLIGNAWKFTAKAEQSRIEIGTLDQEGKIIYYIRDNGVGFDPQYTGRMFWPFHRLHSEAEFEGTGIGLAIVDRIIRRHGGKVWAEGEKEKGATIYFSLS